MYRFFTLVIVIFLASKLISQNHKISGYVLDIETQNPIEDVNISVVGESSGGTTNAEGFFQIQVASVPALLYFSHLNYGISSTSVSQKKLTDVEVFLTKEQTQIDEVQVSAQRIQKVNLGDTLNVIDFSFVGKDRMVLVATPFRNQFDQRLFLTEINGKQLTNLQVRAIGKEIKVPEHMMPETMYLFEDFLGCLQLFTRNEVRQIEILHDSIYLSYSTSFPKFLRYVFPVKAMVGESIFYQRSDMNYNRTYRTGSDAYRPQLVKTVYDPLGSPRGQNIPGRYAYPPGAPKNAHKYVSAPTVEVGNELLIFDFFDNSVEVFDSIGQSKKKMPLDFHLIEKNLALIFKVTELNQEQFNQEIIEDKITGKLYVLFHRFGRRPKIKELDSNTWQVMQVFDFPDYPNIDNVKVHNSVVYFTYHVKVYPFYTSLYRMKI